LDCVRVSKETVVIVLVSLIITPMKNYCPKHCQFILLCHTVYKLTMTFTTKMNQCFTTHVFILKFNFLIDVVVFSRSLVVLLREVLSGGVLLTLMDKLSDPVRNMKI